AVSAPTTRTFRGLPPRPVHPLSTLRRGPREPPRKTRSRRRSSSLPGRDFHPRVTSESFSALLRFLLLQAYLAQREFIPGRGVRARMTFPAPRALLEHPLQSWAGARDRTSSQKSWPPLISCLRLPACPASVRHTGSPMLGGAPPALDSRRSP